MPKSLRNKTLYAVDLGGLLAGASYRGEFEKRMKALIDFVRLTPQETTRARRTSDAVVGEAARRDSKGYWLVLVTAVRPRSGSGRCPFVLLIVSTAWPRST